MSKSLTEELLMVGYLICYFASGTYGSKWWRKLLLYKVFECLILAVYFAYIDVFGGIE